MVCHPLPGETALAGATENIRCLPRLLRPPRASLAWRLSARPADPSGSSTAVFSAGVVFLPVPFARDSPRLPGPLSEVPAVCLGSEQRLLGQAQVRAYRSATSPSPTATPRICRARSTSASSDSAASAEAGDAAGSHVAILS
jgi:hypothetical protein